METGNKVILVESFIDWFNLVNEAFVSGEIARFGTQENRSLKFNDGNRSSYEYSLQHNFQKFQGVLEMELNNLFHKYDKLQYLARYQAEVKAARGKLVRDETGSWHHSQFTFSFDRDWPPEERPDINENDFQDWYILMNSSLEKMIVYLETTRENIRSVEQEDIPPPISLLKITNSSTSEQPIAFFDWFFMRGGLTVLRQKFKDDGREEGDFFSEEDDTRHWMAPKDDVSVEYEYRESRFEDKLNESLLSELNKSIQLITNYIERQQSHEAIKLRLDILLSSLDFYGKQPEQYPLYRRYDICVGVVGNLQKYIRGKYAAFFPARLMTDDFTGKLPEQLPESGNSSAGEKPTAFGIRPQRTELLIERLGSLLISKRLIAPDTKMELLKRAFGASTLDEPLNIRWIARARNGQVNKQSLLHLLNEMTKAKLLSENGSDVGFVKRVPMIFCDVKGKELRHLKVSNAQTSKSITDDKKRINEIIEVLKAEFC
jgi:hypothetical protein